jgi:hypothetical protein
MVLSLLSKNERAYLAGSKEFTAKQRRDIRYRLNKKMKLFGNGEQWGAEGEDLNSRAPTGSSMATVDKPASLDMAGAASSNLARPTFTPFSYDFRNNSMIEQLLIASLRRYRNQAIPSVSSSASAASINCNAAKEEDLKHWIEFHNFLLQRMAYKTAEDTELYKLLNVPS